MPKLRPLRRRLRPSRPIIQVERFSAVATVKDNLAFTTAALSDHAVPYAVLDAPTLRRSVVIVTADHEPAARHALCVVATDQASDPPQLTDVSARVLRVARDRRATGRPSSAASSWAATSSSGR